MALLSGDGVGCGNVVTFSIEKKFLALTRNNVTEKIC